MLNKKCIGISHGFPTLLNGKVQPLSLFDATNLFGIFFIIDMDIMMMVIICVYAKSPIRHSMYCIQWIWSRMESIYPTVSHVTATSKKYSFGIRCNWTKIESNGNFRWIQLCLMDMMIFETHRDIRFSCLSTLTVAPPLFSLSPKWRHCQCEHTNWLGFSFVVSIH